jgi:hypothetical protein
MAGGRQQIDMVLPAAQVPASVHGVEIGFKDAHHQVIGVVVIIAVARGAVEQHLPLALEASIVSRQDM